MFSLKGCQIVAGGRSLAQTTGKDPRGIRTLKGYHRCSDIRSGYGIIFDLCLVKRFDCPLYRTRIGEANVTERMQRGAAVIGGEGNGGVIYPRINFARDSLVGMALILHLIARERLPLSEILSELPHLLMLKKKVTCPSHKIGDVLKMIRQLYVDAPMDLTDGVKVTLPHGWLHVRGSSTEPIIRLSAEAETEGQVNEIAEAAFGLIQERVKS